MSGAERMLGGIAWSAAGAWGSRVASLVVFLVLARLLSPAEIGAVALVGVYLALLQVVGEGGMSDFLVQAQGSSRAQQSGVFWMQLGATLLLAAGFALAAPWLAPKLLPGVEQGVALLRTLPWLMPLSALFKVPESLLRRDLGFKSLAIRSLAMAFGGGAVGVAAAAAGLGVWALVIKQFVEALLGVALLWKLSGWRPTWRVPRAELAAPLRFGGAVLGTRVLQELNARLDALVVSALLGPAALGLYTIAQRLFVMLGELFTAVITNAGLPMLARHQADPPALAQRFLSLLRLGYLATVPAYAVLGALAAPAIVFAFGERWAEAAPPLMWLAASGAVMTLSWYAGCLLFAAGRPAHVLGLTAANLGVALPATIAGGTLAGLVGIAGAALGRNLLLLPAYLRLARSAAPLTTRAVAAAAAPGLATAALAGAAAWSVHALAAGAGLAPLAALASAVASAGLVQLALLRHFEPGVFALARTRVSHLLRPAP